MTGSTLRPGEVFAGYRIKRLLGVGGMGEVYLARDGGLPRDIALKLLAPAARRDPEVRQRFQREADIVAHLNHPNIITVHARGEEHGQLWIAMGYVGGTDLATALRGGALDLDRAVRILAEAAAALDCAHEAGVLHRDVKPANILLTTGSPERAVLTDFGIAKILDENTALTRTGEVLVSFRYAAPERLGSGTADDRRGDVYSLGCTFFHMLTGVPPYAGSGAAQLMHAHLHAPVPTASDHDHAIPAALNDVLARSLAKDPANRFGTCGELSSAVAAALTRADGLRHHGAATIGAAPHTVRAATFADARTEISPSTHQSATVVSADAARAAEPPTSSQSPLATTARRGRRRTLRAGAAIAAVAASVVSYVLVADHSGKAQSPRVTATFAAGEYPQKVALNPSVHTGYVTNQASNTVSVFDTETNTVTATIPTDQGPTGMAIAPADHLLCLTSWISQTVSVIDTATNTVTGIIPVGKAPIGVALDLTLGAHPIAFVTNTNSDTISVIDTGTHTVIATIPIEDPWQVAVDPATHTGYVTNNTGNTVSVIDTASNTLTGRIRGPVAVTVDASARTAYVTNADSNTVSVIDTSTNSVTATIAVGEAPGGIAVDPATHVAYVSNRGSNTVSVIDTGTNSVTATIPVAEAPGSLTVDPTTHAVYVTAAGGTISILSR